MCSLLTIASRWCSWSVDIHLNDNEDPPPGGLQTRVDDRPGTSSSSCFPVVRKTNSEIWKTRSHRILRQSKGPANFSSHLRRLPARVGNVERASSKLEILGTYPQLLLQLSAVLTRIEANGSFSIVLIHYPRLSAAVNKRSFACRLKCNNSF